MRLAILTVCLTMSTTASASDGCNSQVSDYLKKAAASGAKAEQETVSVEKLPRSRDVTCLQSILDKKVDFFVSFPNFADIAGRAAKDGCQAVSDAVDGVINSIGDVSLDGGLNVPGIGNVGSGIGLNLHNNGSTPIGKVAGKVSSDLQDALSKLRKGGNQ